MNNLKLAVELFISEAENSDINKRFPWFYNKVIALKHALQSPPTTGEADAVREALEKAWARQIAEVVGNQQAVRIIELARLNGLFEIAPPSQQIGDEALVNYEKQA